MVISSSRQDDLKPPVVEEHVSSPTQERVLISQKKEDCGSLIADKQDKNVLHTSSQNNTRIQNFVGTPKPPRGRGRLRNHVKLPNQPPFTTPITTTPERHLNTTPSCIQRRKRRAHGRNGPLSQQDTLGLATLGGTPDLRSRFPNPSTPTVQISPFSSFSPTFRSLSPASDAAHNLKDLSFQNSPSTNKEEVASGTMGTSPVSSFTSYQARSSTYTPSPGGEACLASAATEETVPSSMVSSNQETVGSMYNCGSLPTTPSPRLVPLTVLSKNGNRCYPSNSIEKMGSFRSDQKSPLMMSIEVERKRNQSDDLATPGTSSPSSFPSLPPKNICGGRGSVSGDRTDKLSQQPIFERKKFTLSPRSTLPKMIPNPCSSPERLSLPLSSSPLASGTILNDMDIEPKTNANDVSRVTSSGTQNDDSVAFDTDDDEVIGTTMDKLLSGFTREDKQQQHLKSIPNLDRDSGGSSGRMPPLPSIRPSQRAETGSSNSLTYSTNGSSAASVRHLGDPQDTLEVPVAHFVKDVASRVGKEGSESPQGTTLSPPHSASRSGELGQSGDGVKIKSVLTPSRSGGFLRALRKADKAHQAVSGNDIGTRGDDDEDEFFLMSPISKASKRREDGTCFQKSPLLGRKCKPSDEGPISLNCVSASPPALNHNISSEVQGCPSGRCVILCENNMPPIGHQGSSMKPQRLETVDDEQKRMMSLSSSQRPHVVSSSHSMESLSSLGLPLDGGLSVSPRPHSLELAKTTNLSSKQQQQQQQQQQESSFLSVVRPLQGSLGSNGNMVHSPVATPILPEHSEECRNKGAAAFTCISSSDRESVNLAIARMAAQEASLKTKQDSNIKML